MPHGLSDEGNNRCEIMPVQMERLFWEYIGQSSVFVGKKSKGEMRGEEGGGLGEGIRMEDWTPW